MLPPMVWVLLFFLMVFIAFLILPRMYLALHAWVRDTRPEIIYDRMYGLSYLTNYRPLIASLSFRMHHFYGKWALISVLWGSIFTFWFAAVLFAHVGNKQTLCFSTFIIFFVLMPLFMWGTAKYMFKKYREEQRGRRH